MLSNHNSLLLFLLLPLLFLFTQVLSSLPPTHPPISPQEALFEDKARLGSTPPSCHNKCNGCHPCMAIQVPTLPSHDRVDRVSGGLVRSPPRLRPGRVFDPSAASGVNQYSNYKPMGWKCHCNGHFYNP